MVILTWTLDTCYCTVRSKSSIIFPLSCYSAESCRCLELRPVTSHNVKLTQLNHCGWYQDAVPIKICTRLVKSRNFWPWLYIDISIYICMHILLFCLTSIVLLINDWSNTLKQQMLGTHWWGTVEHTHFSWSDDGEDGVYLGAIQITIKFTILKVPVMANVRLHCLSCSKVVCLPIFLQLSHWSGCIYR